MSRLAFEYTDRPDTRQRRRVEPKPLIAWRFWGVVLLILAAGALAGLVSTRVPAPAIEIPLVR